MLLNSSVRNKGMLSASVSNSSTSTEITLLEEALDECDRSRKFFADENGHLRELVGEVEEWADRMGQLRGITSGGTTDIDRIDEVGSVSDLVGSRDRCR